MIPSEKKNILQKSKRIKALIFFCTLSIIVLLFPKGESIESEVNVGSIWIQEDLIATTSFPIYKNPEILALERRSAAERILPIFIKKGNVYKQSLDSLRVYNKYLKELIDKDLKAEITGISVKFLSPSAYNTFKNLRRQELTGSGKSLQRVLSISEDILRHVYLNDIINLLYNEIPKDSIAVRTGRIDNIHHKRKFQDLRVVQDYIADYTSTIEKDQNVVNTLIEYVNHFIRPNLIYSERLTQEEIEHAVNKISPNTGIVNENERIIAKHDRITEDAKLKIDSYRKAKAEESGFLNDFSQFLGKFLHILLIITLWAIYFYIFRKKIFQDNLKILLISIILLFICFITFLIHSLDVNSPVHLLIIIPAASMMLTIIFDSRVGFYGTVIISMVAGGLRGNDYSFTVMNIFAGALAAYTVRDIKNRTQIFRSFVYIFVGYMISILAFGLERFETFDKILVEFAFAASNALISPIFTFGMIIFFEKSFKITTDLTLLELTDFNNPLLKTLAKNAPGTFTHSITVGSLVERAAEAIGANPLLARVGAYYHDIGKTMNPDIFAENQLQNNNTHEKLNPMESAKLIIEHVNKGIELGKEENLPQEIINFIPMHHGTLVAAYFYEKAKELYGEENVDINDFRYKGPKPNSKETALVMLADACESTVRSIEEPEPVKMENVINSLIKYRVQDGQLDESPITLNDLKIIKETFLNILLGQHHKRIRYPKQDEMENK